MLTLPMRKEGFLGVENYKFHYSLGRGKDRRVRELKQTIVSSFRP
jgi:hypothetical protein